MCASSRNSITSHVTRFLVTATSLLITSALSGVAPPPHARITTNIGASLMASAASSRSIRHLPCISRRTGIKGTCMFAIDCLKANGTHLGTCIDHFYFGSCCRMPPDTVPALPGIVDNTIEDSSGLSSLGDVSLPSPGNVISVLNPSTSIFTSTSTKKPSSSKPVTNTTTKKQPTRAPTKTKPTTKPPNTTTEKFVTTQRVDTTTIRRRVTPTTISSVTRRPVTRPISKPSQTTLGVPIMTRPVHRTTTRKPTTTHIIPTTIKRNYTYTIRIPDATTIKYGPTKIKPPENEIVKVKKNATTTENPYKISTFHSIEATTTVPSSRPTRPATRPTVRPTSRPTTRSTLRPTQKVTQKPVISKPTQKPIIYRPNQKPNITITSSTTRVPQKPQITTSRPKPTLTTKKPFTSKPTISVTKPLRPVPVKNVTTTKRPVSVQSTPTRIRPTTVKPLNTTVKTTQKPVTTTAVPTTNLPIKLTTISSVSPPETTERTTEKPLIVPIVTFKPDLSTESTKKPISVTTSGTPEPVATNEVLPPDELKPPSGFVTWTNIVEEPTTAAPLNASFNSTDSSKQPSITPSSGTTEDSWVLLPNVDPNSTSPDTMLFPTEGPGSMAAASGASTTWVQPDSEMVTTRPVVFPGKQNTTTQMQSTDSTTSSSLDSATPQEPPGGTFPEDSTLPSSTSSGSLNISSPAVDLIDEFSAQDVVNMSDYTQVCGRRMFPRARIVGGKNSSFGRWPWQISLRQWRTSTYLHKCGAALLNENWAITAAHCVDNIPPSDLLLRLGEHDLSSESEPHGFQERRVQIVASHPQFDPRTFEYDLALLRFYEPVTFQPNIIPVCVPDNDERYIGKTAYVTGWGRLYEDGPLPATLQEVSVPVINNSLCEYMYRSAGYIEHIPEIFICAGWRRGGYDSCEGDSGGPMVIPRTDKRFTLAGVISWGIGCAEPNQPGVYTRISEFRHWINQILQF